VNTQVLVRIEEDGAGAERLAALADALRTELLNLDVDDVRPVRFGRPPAGARAVDIAASGSLLASIGDSATALSQLVTAVRSWVGRSRGTAARTVEVSVGDNSLRLTGASAEQQDRMIEAFVRTVAQQ
jgi:hypothetical protein